MCRHVAPNPACAARQRRPGGNRARSFVRTLPGRFFYMPAHTGHRNSVCHPMGMHGNAAAKKAMANMVGNVKLYLRSLAENVMLTL